MMANSKQLECCSRGTTNNRQNRTRNEQARNDTTSSSSSSITSLQSLLMQTCVVLLFRRARPCTNDSGQDCVQLSAQHSDSEGPIEDDDTGERMT